MSARRLALFLACALAIAGCASTAQKTPPPAPATAPPTPPPTTVTEEPQAPPVRGPATSPWDTAGTASGRASRRAHVYPQGPSPLGQKLVNAIPDPSSVKPGVQSKEPGTTPVPPPPPPPVQDPAPVASGTCYDVQILVTSDKGRAEEARDRAERELNLSAWVKHDGMMHRVRVGGCLTAEGAAGLARRLHDEGYPEAFRVVREP